MADEMDMDRGDGYLGVLGGFVGTLPGTVLWIAAYRLGWVHAIAGGIMMVCALIGYEKLGKGLDAGKVMVCIVMTVAMMYVGQRFVATIEQVAALKGVGESVSYYKTYTEIMSSLDAAGKKDFYTNVGIGCGFAAVFGIAYAFVRNRLNKKQENS